MQSDVPLLAVSSRGDYLAEISDEDFIQPGFNSIGLN